MMSKHKKCKSNGKWYGVYPYETKCTVCGIYFLEDQPPPDCRGYDESKYGIKEAEWKLLDPGNPAFRPVGFKDWGKNMQADFKILPGETSEMYWDRVRNTLLLIRQKKMEKNNGGNHHDCPTR